MKIRSKNKTKTQVEYIVAKIERKYKFLNEIKIMSKTIEKKNVKLMR